jgi:hypothetical protein
MPSTPAVPALAPAEQTACYSPWLKVRVLIRAALAQAWAPETWPEVCGRSTAPGTETGPTAIETFEEVRVGLAVLLRV